MSFFPTQDGGIFGQGAFQIDQNSTPEMIKAKRAQLAALMPQYGKARYVGEGLGQLFSGIATGRKNRALDKFEGERRSEASKTFNNIFTGGSQNGGNSGPMSVLGMRQPAAPTPPSPDQAIADDTMAALGREPIAPAPFGGDLKAGIAETAEALGIDPVDLATAISYETAGTFDPTKKGPTTQWGQHQGLIQFGEPQAQKYGVNWDDPIGSQLGSDGAVAKYLRDTGVQPGMGLMDIYSAINAGGVGRNNRSDANNGGAPGTVADKVNKQMAGHREKALAMFGGQSSFAPGAGVQVAQNNPQLDSLITAAQNPWLSPQQQNVINGQIRQLQGQQQSQLQRQQGREDYLWKQEQNQADPKYQLDLQKARRDLSAAPKRETIQGQDGRQYYLDTQEPVLPNVRPKPIDPTTSQRDYDFYKRQEESAGREPLSFNQWDLQSRKAGANSTTVNNDLGNQGEFDKKTGAALAASTNDIVVAGDTAQRSLITLSRLESALSGAPQGIAGSLASMAGSIGIKSEGSSELEVAEALISQLVPAQRPPGSGTMSDADLALFKKSLPAIINTPDGNKKIIETIRAIAEYDIARSDIAAAVQFGDMTHSEARKAYREIPNPLDQYSGSVSDTSQGPEPQGAVTHRFNPATGKIEAVQ